MQAGGNVYAEHFHGRSVLSVMAGKVEGELLGTAPAADYVLLRTEDADSEHIVEEDNWVSGAEVCDSIGCDVLDTSLGYTTFDDSTQDHTYADLNGLTSRMTDLTADIATRKGMISGEQRREQRRERLAFHRRTCDACDILAVGAVDNDRVLASF